MNITVVTFASEVFSQINERVKDNLQPFKLRCHRLFEQKNLVYALASSLFGN